MPNNVTLDTITAADVANLQPGPETDAMVMAALGYRVCLEENWFDGQGKGTQLIPKVSICHNAAHAALDKLGVHYNIVHYPTGAEPNGVRLQFPGIVKTFWADTAPLAAARAIVAMAVAKREIGILKHRVMMLEIWKAEHVKRRDQPQIRVIEITPAGCRGVIVDARESWANTLRYIEQSLDYQLRETEVGVTEWDDISLAIQCKTITREEFDEAEENSE